MKKPLQMIIASMSLTVLSGLVAHAASVAVEDGTTTTWDSLDYTSMTSTAVNASTGVLKTENYSENWNRIQSFTSVNNGIVTSLSMLATSLTNGTYYVDVYKSYNGDGSSFTAYPSKFRPWSTDWLDPVLTNLAFSVDSDDVITNGLGVLTVNLSINEQFAITNEGAYAVVFRAATNTEHLAWGYSSDASQTDDGCFGYTGQTIVTGRDYALGYNFDPVGIQPIPKSEATFTTELEGWNNNAFQTLDPIDVDSFDNYSMNASDTEGVGVVFDVWTNMTVDTIRFWQTRYYATNSLTVEIYSNINQNITMESQMIPGNLMKSIVVYPKAIHDSDDGNNVMEISLVEDDQFVIDEIPDGVDPMGYYMYVYPTDALSSDNLFLWNYATYDINSNSAYATPSSTLTDRELGMALVSSEGHEAPPLPSAGASNEVVLVSNADTRITWQFAPDGNYGNDTTISTRQYDPARDYMLYVRFDLRDLTGAITNANLRLWKSGGDILNNERIHVWGLDNVASNTPQDWMETSLTWNNAGAEIINTNAAATNAIAGNSLLFPNRVTDFDDGVSGITETIDNGVLLEGQTLIDWLESRRKDGGLATFIVDLPAIGDPTKNVEISYYAKEFSERAAPKLTLEVGPTEVGYQIWIEDYDVGSLTNTTDDADSDGRNNLYEYAFGGDPSVSDSGHATSFSTDASWFYYVYPRRADAEAAELTYALDLGANLPFNDWANGIEGIDYQELGTDEWPGDAEYNAVSNRIPIDTDVKFIRVEFSNPE